MRFIHTFWSKPLLNNKHNTFSASLRYLLSNYAYSAHCVKQFGHEMVLYTDSYGAELFSFIPYDKVVILENDEEENMHFFARFKFETLKKCELGDVIIDGDIFLFKQESYDIINQPYDLIYSFTESPEYNYNSYNLIANGGLLSKLNEFQYEAPYRLPTCCAETGTFNTSVLKINNKNLLREYIEQYDKHYNMLKNVDFKQNEWPDLIIEQYFLKCLCEYNNKYFTNPIIHDLSIEDNADKMGFIHCGGAKYTIQPQIDNWLMNSNYELYKKYVE